MAETTPYRFLSAINNPYFCMQTEQEIHLGSLNKLKPHKAPNKAFLKLKLDRRSQIEQFETNRKNPAANTSFLEVEIGRLVIG